METRRVNSHTTDRQALALRVLAAEIEAGTPLPARVARMVAAITLDPAVRVLVREWREDVRDVAAARLSLARGEKTIPYAVVKRELG